MKRTRYRLLKVNAETMEHQPVSSKPLTKTQADLLIKSRVFCPPGWFYTKEAIGD